MAQMEPVTSTSTTTTVASTSTTTTVQTTTRPEEKNFSEIAEQSRQLFLYFLTDRLAKDGHDQGCIRQITEEHREFQIEPSSPTRRVAEAIKLIGDELDADQHLNGLLRRLHVASSTAYGTFRRVALQIFQDGYFNWGRIVTLFFFGYRLALRVLTESSIIKMIIGWIVRFIYEICSIWIAEHGGWVRYTVVNYFYYAQNENFLKYQNHLRILSYLLAMYLPNILYAYFLH